ncbi:MAG: glycosyltransferase [Bacteroides sp.]|nr:glycosyltransferase [Bacteroides sp.]
MSNRILNNKVAILLPIYRKDTPKYISESLDSLFNQSYKNITVYVGLDGEVTSEINKILITFIEVHPSMKVIRFPQNRGLACILNDLLEICFQDGFAYVARMDADDLSLPNRIERQLHYLESHNEVDVVGGAIEEIDESSKKNRKK